MIRVNVVLVRDAVYSSTQSRLRKVFSGSMFTLHYPSVTETYECIKYADSLHSKCFTVLVSDTMLPNLSPNKCSSKISHMVRTMIASKASVCYLNRYMDECQMMERVEDDIYRTWSPHGVGCLLISPKGCGMLAGNKKMPNGRYFKVSKRMDLDKKLHKEIYQGNIKALASSPTLFHFNMECATKDKEYERRCECLPLQLLAPPVDEDTSSSILYFVVALAVIVSVAYALIYIGPKT